MDKEILAVLFSGQLILVVWQVIKEVADRRSKKKQEQDKGASETAEIKSLVFKLYRDSLKQKTISMDAKVENPTPAIKAELMDLHDDFKLYRECGGNGLVKHLYDHLCDKVRDQLGEEYYVLLCTEEDCADNICQR